MIDPVSGQTETQQLASSDQTSLAAGNLTDGSIQRLGSAANDQIDSCWKGKWTFASITGVNVHRWFSRERRWTFASITGVNVHRRFRGARRWTVACWTGAVRTGIRHPGAVRTGIRHPGGVRTRTGRPEAGGARIRIGRSGVGTGDALARRHAADCAAARWGRGAG